MIWLPERLPNPDGLPEAFRKVEFGRSGTILLNHLVPGVGANSFAPGDMENVYTHDRPNPPF